MFHNISEIEELQADQLERHEMEKTNLTDSYGRIASHKKDLSPDEVRKAGASILRRNVESEDCIVEVVLE